MGRERILVLDDARGRAYRALAGDELAHNSTVDLELSMAVARERLRSGEFGVLVIGAPLTALEGILLLQDLRAEYDHEIAVVVIADKGQSVMLLDAMADDCCIRPIADDEFVARVHALLARRVARSA